MKKPVYKLLNVENSTKLVSEDLESLSSFLSLIPEDEKNRWLIKPHGHDWIPVPEYLLATGKTLTSLSNKAELPEPGSEKRQHPRFQIRLQVTIVTGCRSFTTYSKNLSLGGLLLERSIPAEMRTNSCRVFLVTPKKDKMIELKGKITTQAQNQFRLAFVEPSERFLGELLEWMHKFEPDFRRAA